MCPENTTSVISAYLLHLLVLSRTWEQLARNNNMTVEEICAEQPDFLKDTEATKAFYSLTVILFLCDMVIEVLYKVSMISRPIAYTMKNIVFICIHV